MAAFSQVLLIHLLLGTANCWPFPWLQHALNQPQIQLLELIDPYPLLQLQNVPYANMFNFQNLLQRPESLDVNYIIDQIPIKVEEYPAYIDDEFFSGYGPDKVTWWSQIPEKPNDVGIYHNVIDDQDNYGIDKDGDVNGQIGDNNTNYYSNKESDVDENKNNNKPASNDIIPYNREGVWPFDPRRDEAKYDKPH